MHEVIAPTNVQLHRICIYTIVIRKHIKEFINPVFDATEFLVSSESNTKCTYMICWEEDMKTEVNTSVATTEMNENEYVHKWLTYNFSLKNKIN